MNTPNVIPVSTENIDSPTINLTEKIIQVSGWILLTSIILLFFIFAFGDQSPEEITEVTRDIPRPDSVNVKENDVAPDQVVSVYSAATAEDLKKQLQANELWSVDPHIKIKPFLLSAFPDDLKQQRYFRYKIEIKIREIFESGNHPSN